MSSSRGWTLLSPATARRLHRQPSSAPGQSSRGGKSGANATCTAFAGAGGSSGSGTAGDRKARFVPLPVSGAADSGPFFSGTGTVGGRAAWLDWDAGLLAGVAGLLGPVRARTRRRSERLDRLFLRPACGVPLFCLLMAGVLFLTFGPVGETLSAGFSRLLLALPAALVARLPSGAPEWLRSLLREGVLGGVGAVLSFLPRLALLFFFQAALEQSGLLARVNRLADPLLRRFGLRGDAVTPLLLGFGCSVPAVLCTRGMKDARARERCARFVPAVACSARMPLCLTVADCCFPGAGWMVCGAVWLFSGRCFLGFCALTAGRGRRSPPALHADPLPRWRLPAPRELAGSVLEQVLHFAGRAGGLILLFSVLVWLLSSFRPGQAAPVAPGQSLLAALGGAMAPLLRPIGLGDWRIAAALLAGVGAKEAALSTLGVLLGGGARPLSEAIAASGLLTPASALSLLVFYTLYFPCAATVAVLGRGQRRWLWLPLVFAYLLAFLVFRLSGG